VIFTQKCVAFPPNDYAFEASHQNLECIAKVIANTMYEKHVANCTTLTVPANVLTSKTIFNSLFAKSWTQSYDLALQLQHCKKFTIQLCICICFLNYALAFHNAGDVDVNLAVVGVGPEWLQGCQMVCFQTKKSQFG
jgi:hypothetical protein